MDLKKLKNTAAENVIFENLDQVHNCYVDLKNKWNENAKDFNDEKLKFFYTVSAVFILGFLFSQLRIYISQDSQALVVEENFPVNSTKFTQDSEFFIDYASVHNGGSILTEYSMPEYLGWFSLFSNNRRESIISDNNEPGSCWPFDGSYGFIGIKLSDTIFPKSFTIFHLNSLNYTNAPKTLKVYSLSHLNESILLSEYEFDLKIKSEKRKNWQNFPCQSFCEHATDSLLLEIINNHGGEKTCVYQLKVHGKPAKS